MQSGRSSKDVENKKNLIKKNSKNELISESKSSDSQLCTDGSNSCLSSVIKELIRPSETDFGTIKADLTFINEREYLIDKAHEKNLIETPEDHIPFTKYQNIKISRTKAMDSAHEILNQEIPPILKRYKDLDSPKYDSLTLPTDLTQMPSHSMDVYPRKDSVLDAVGMNNVQDEERRRRKRRKLSGPTELPKTSTDLKSKRFTVTDEEKYDSFRKRTDSIRQQNLKK